MGLKGKKEDVFFTMFREFSNDVNAMGEDFNSFIHTFPGPEGFSDTMKKRESECDRKKHAIISELNNSFVTPFDREDLFMLAQQLDDIADYMEEIVSEFDTYGVQKLRPDAANLAELIFEQVKQVVVLFDSLPESQKNLATHDAVININHLEDKGDILFRQALKKLFAEEKDPLEVIRWKALYEVIEDALDAGEHLADTVEGILTKNA